MARRDVELLVSQRLGPGTRALPALQVSARARGNLEFFLPMDDAEMEDPNPKADVELWWSEDGLVWRRKWAYLDALGGGIPVRNGVPLGGHYFGCSASGLRGKWVQLRVVTKRPVTLAVRQSYDDGDDVVR